MHQTGRWERDTSAADRIVARSHKPNSERNRAAKITLADGLAKELVDAFNNVGRAINKKYEHHKLCEQNRAYAHYRRTK